MLQFISMLLGLVFGHHNAQKSACSKANNGFITIQNTRREGDPNARTGGPVGGNSGQLPPPFTNP